MTQPLQQSIDGQMSDVLPAAKEWIERWYGSDPYKGWAIMAGNEEIAVIGDSLTAEQVRDIVSRHNQDLQQAIAATQVVADQPDTESKRKKIILDCWMAIDELRPSGSDHFMDMSLSDTIRALLASNTGKASSDQGEQQ